MTTDPTDVRIVGLDEARTARADTGEPLFDVHFALSAGVPAGWPMIATTRLARRGVAGRRGWATGRAVVVRCAIDEVEAVLTALRPLLRRANREYRAWRDGREQTRLADAAFDRTERQKLLALTARLAAGWRAEPVYPSGLTEGRL